MVISVLSTFTKLHTIQRDDKLTIPPSRMNPHEQTLITFELNQLPYDVRECIWKAITEPGMVGFAPRRDVLSRRRSLPIVSQVCQESRSIFLRYYTRLVDTTNAAQEGDQPYVWINTAVDQLILGFASRVRTAPDDGDLVKIGSQVHHGARLVFGDIIEVPRMPRSARNKLREIYLSDFDAYETLCDMEACQPPQSPRIALPDNLYFPNLEKIHIASMNHIFSLPGNARGITFKYLTATDELYALPRIEGRLSDGIQCFDSLSINGGKPLSGSGCWMIHLEVIREDDYSWWSEEWLQPEDAEEEEEGSHVLSYAELWQHTVDYLVLRLPSDN